MIKHEAERSTEITEWSEKRKKKIYKKLRIENERKVTQELEINQDPFK